jgi:hypothetical protein
MSGAGNSHPGRQSAEDRKQAVLPHPSSSGAVPRAQVGRAALLGAACSSQGARVSRECNETCLARAGEQLPGALTPPGPPAAPQRRSADRTWRGGQSPETELGPTVVRASEQAWRTSLRTSSGGSRLSADRSRSPERAAGSPGGVGPARSADARALQQWREQGGAPGDLTPTYDISPADSLHEHDSLEPEERAAAPAAAAKAAAADAAGLEQLRSELEVQRQASAKLAEMLKAARAAQAGGQHAAEVLAVCAPAAQQPPQPERRPAAPQIGLRPLAAR